MAIFLWLYTFFLIIIWGFFIIAKVHAYKFKDFSERIESVTKIMLILMIILSLSWYALIIYMWNWKNTWKLDFTKKDYYFNEVNY